MKGLSANVRLYVAMARPTTLDQAMEHAVHLEATMLGSLGIQRG